MKIVITNDDEQDTITIIHQLPGEVHSIDVEFGFYIDDEDNKCKSTQKS